jgi:hypothetical protein
LIGILTSLGSCSNGPDSYEDEGCMTVEATVTSCPAAKDVALDKLYLPMQCGLDIVGVKGTGERKEITGQDGTPMPSCCYTVDVVDPDPNGNCVVGRPYREGGVLRQAPLEAHGASPRAEAWVRAGAGEHASVAAFSRLALQLMAHGAPTELLRAVYEAALDEVRHAEICWEMARRSGAGAIAPTPFPFGAPVDVSSSLTTLAVSATREGCIAETLGAHVADLAAEMAPDPEVRAALRSIADDEARHAALSYRIVQWAMQSGGAEVRDAVRSAFAEPCPRVDTAELALRAGVDPGLLDRATRQASYDVIRPAAMALLAA